MSDGRLGHVLRHLRRLTGAPGCAPDSDGQLLKRFAAGRDEAAFAELLRRHGPMVLGVCRRVLRHEHDAEDAFQATFLVLARKAGSFRPGGAVGGWLYEVARHIAGRARADAARRRACERHAAPGIGAAADEEAARRELGPLLDEELRRLPERCRLPLVLCDLQGKTHAEAARELGWPLGSMSKRLARGRDLLRGRLARRGVTLSAAALAAALAAEATAAVPAALGQAALRLVLLAAVGEAAASAVPGPVVALADGAVRQMFLSRVRTVVAVLLVVALVGTGVGLLAHQAPADAPPAAKDDKPVPPAPAPGRADRYGDALPAGAVARLGTVRLRHRQWVYAVAFSPDGKTLASAGWDEVIRLWDAETGKPVGELAAPQRNGTNAVAFSPDGKKLAAVGFKGTVRLWDLTTRRMLFEEQAHKDSAYGVCFAPDGRFFASAGDVIHLWDANTGAKLRTMPVQDRATEYGHCVAISPDGKLLAAGSGQAIRLWGMETDGDPVVIEKAHTSSVDSVAFAADGKTLISGGHRSVETLLQPIRLTTVRYIPEIRLWDAVTGELLRELKVDELAEGVCGVAVSPDGKLLASAHHGRIRIWNLKTGKPLRDLIDFPTTFGPSAQGLAFSPDGKLLAAQGGDNAVGVWKVATGERHLDFPQSHTSHVEAVAYSADGRLVVTGGYDGGVRVWDVAAARELRSFRLTTGRSGVAAVAVSPDGKMVAAGGVEASEKEWSVGRLTLWDTATGKELLTEQLKGLVSALAFAPDGSTLAVAAFEDDGNGRTQGKGDGYVHLFDPAMGKQWSRLTGHGWRIREVAFTPDGKELASAGFDGTVLVWDCRSGAQRSRFQMEVQRLGSAAFSADGKTVVAGAGYDEPLVVRDVATGRELLRLHAAGSKGSVVALSPDGRLLASGSVAPRLVSDENDRALHLWEMATGREVATFQAGDQTAAALAFAPDGKALVSGMSDGTALVWEVMPSKPGRALAPEELERLWADLAGDDAARAHEAAKGLVAGAGQSVLFLKERLPPSVAVKPERLRQLVTDLDGDRFAVRDAAAKELERLGDQAAPALRQALEADASPEFRKRVEALLASPLLVRSADVLRRLRAIAALEHVGSPEARQVLERLAKGDPTARETREAQASRDRLARQSSAAP